LTHLPGDFNPIHPRHADFQHYADGRSDGSMSSAGPALAVRTSAPIMIAVAPISNRAASKL
jgi:hypothetical protein